MNIKSIILSMLFICSISSFAQESEVTKVLFPTGYESKIDEVYTKVNDWYGRLDLYYNPLSTKPTPVVLHIHGGGWNHGTKEGQTGFSSYFKAGFAVVNVEYRLVQVATAPAAIEDIRTALHYIKENAKKLNIDPDKIVIEGGSSGAHLALMVGLLENNRIFDTNCSSELGMKVAAIISNYAPSDLPSLLINSTLTNSLTKWLGDKANNSEFIASVSPLTYIKKTSPPVFIVHGNADKIIPYSQSVTLQKKLNETGVYNEFITVEGGGHGSFEKEKKTEINLALIDFLRKVEVIE